MVYGKFRSIQFDELTFRTIFTFYRLPCPLYFFRVSESSSGNTTRDNPKMYRRSALLTIGGFFLAPQFAHAQIRRGHLPSLQTETGRAAGRVAQVGKELPQTQSAVRLCHLLEHRCEQNSRVSPALVQATLDATRRARKASIRTDAFLQSTTAFQQLAERLIAATAQTRSDLTVAVGTE